MIAEAIKSRLPDVRNVSVDMMTIRWSDPKTGWRYIYFTPKPAQWALLRFDRGLPSKPFSFRVRSGQATPMILGTGKKRRRAHKVSKHGTIKTSDRGSLVHGVRSNTIPMWPKDKDCADFVPPMPGKPVIGRPKEWHPSHNRNRRYGLRGFTQDDELKA